MKSKLMIVVGILGPVLAGLLTIPMVIEQLPQNATAEAVFTKILLASLPALVVAAVGALMTLVGGVTLLIDSTRPPKRLTTATLAWLLGAALLPCLFAGVVVVGVVKQYL